MQEEKKPVEESKAAEEGKKEEAPKAAEEGKEEKKPEEAKAEPPPPQEIVLKVFMHCEGCARKVRRCLKGFEGNKYIDLNAASCAPAFLLLI